jgi:LmbE family N-acetylglucosaminyl deacetylase
MPAKTNVGTGDGDDLSSNAPKARKVIFVGCHPDDIELGCGGTIAVFRQCGFQVLCIFLTKGGHCGSEDGRVDESRKALGMLGVPKDDIFFGEGKDTALAESHEYIDYLESFYTTDAGGVKRPQPEVYAVFMHYFEDTHQDHRAAANICLSAFRRAPRLYAFESPSTRGSFAPTTYVDITGKLDTKGNALKCHESQLDRGAWYLEYKAMLNLATFRGRQAGGAIECAEGFHTLKNLIDPKLAIP